MHIVVIGLRGIPDVMGGIETHCSQLLPMLIEESDEPDTRITVMARRGYVSTRSQYGRLVQVPLWHPSSKGLEAIVHTFVALIYARLFLRPDVVHLHAIGPGLLTPLARLLGFNILFTHHGEDYRRDKWGRVAKTALRLGEGLALRFAHQIITVSPRSAARLKREYPAKADRISYIPNGFTRSTENYTPAMLEPMGLTEGRYIVNVARLVPEKAQDTLIEAFRASGLSRQEPPWRLVLVGDADHSSAFAASIAAEAADDEHILLAGRVPRDKALGLIGYAGLFVLPSYHEGLSIAALEAMDAGTPVLLSDIAANRAFALPDRNYFEVGSVADLTRKLDEGAGALSLDDPMDLTDFEWRNIARETRGKIRRLVGDGGTEIGCSAS